MYDKDLDRIKIQLDKRMEKGTKEYQQGYADAIDKFVNTLCNVNWELVSLVNIPTFIMSIAEQLKESE